jgi:uncharacterized protein YuzE
MYFTINYTYKSISYLSQEDDGKGGEVDLEIDFDGEIIAIEHRSNLALSNNLKKRDMIGQCIDKQASIYHEHLNASQT